MFNVAIDSKLLGCDVVSLKVEDTVRMERRSTATVRQRKTGHPVRFKHTGQSSGLQQDVSALRVCPSLQVTAAFNELIEWLHIA